MQNVITFFDSRKGDIFLLDRWFLLSVFLSADVFYSHKLSKKQIRSEMSSGLISATYAVCSVMVDSVLCLTRVFICSTISPM